MNTSIMTVVLASAVFAGQGGTPTWHNSYNKAQELGASQKKPLAIVVGSGANGWTKIVKDGTPPAEATQMLAQKYICVYVDTATSQGKKLASDLGITLTTGLILSDRTAALQAFWHQGDLSNQALTQYLQKYSDANVVVTTTETVNSVRTSFYPSYGTPSYGTYSSGGAPSIRAANC